MIVVVVVDTSPSMGRPAKGDSGLSRLDVAKMAVEDLVRQWRKSRAAHASSCDQQYANLGQLPGLDQFLLLSTSRQKHPETAAYAAGGRLLVGFGSVEQQQQQQQQQMQQQHAQQEGSPPIDPVQQQQQKNAETFARELKELTVATVDPNKNWPEGAGGAIGLNAALSAGLQLLSRYRLKNRQTENFGMGRLPNPALPMPNGSAASFALQPACLILLTDGACLRHPPKQGGGPLQLRYGSQPLTEFYKEPFRWDQRIFVQAIGAREGVNSTIYLHPQLRTLCEVTGGAHGVIRGSSDLQGATEALLKRISPPMPKELPLPDPLYLRIDADAAAPPLSTMSTGNGSSFVNGGPICTFQSLENDDRTGSPHSFRAMLLYTSSSATVTPKQDTAILSPPLFCIPEAFFPSKKLDTLPPRSAQPRLYFSKYAPNLGSKSFEPIKVIKMLHKLDQLLTANREATGQQVKLMHRDVYVCEWLDAEGAKPVTVHISSRQDYFPVLVPGAGRPSLSDDGDNYLNIGILHVPPGSSTLASQAGPSRLATLTLMPPDPQIILPLLLRAAEAEHRAIKASCGKQPADATVEAKKQAAARAVVSLDENWRTELRAYLFRLPPYYQSSLKRCLRPILPASAHSLLLAEANSIEAIAMQSFSKLCHQKIRQGEQIAQDSNERLERQEQSLRRSNLAVDPTRNEGQPITYGYGQYDPRTSTDTYLAALRNLPAPWRVAKRANEIPHGQGPSREISAVTRDTSTSSAATAVQSPRSAVDVLGDLPAKCMMAYYESRRRWIFGGPGLATRGLHVDGVRNDGGNTHHCEADECPLSLAGIGVSTLNQTSTTKMGEYRERLLFARSPVVGYGSSDTGGVSATTAIDGSPTWSVDDDALPMTFFDPKTGEFADSVQARVRSKLQVNFGNPYREKRADSMIPEIWLQQAPSMQQGGLGKVIGSPRTPPGSPPQDSFDSTLEEGEAVFVRSSPTRQSPKREEPEEAIKLPPAKRPRSDSEDTTESSTSSSSEGKPPIQPPKPAHVPPPKPPNPSQLKNKPAPPGRQKSSGLPPKRPPKKAPPPPPKPPAVRPATKGPPPKKPPQSEQASKSVARRPEAPKPPKVSQAPKPPTQLDQAPTTPLVEPVFKSAKLEDGPKTPLVEQAVKVFKPGPPPGPPLVEPAAKEVSIKQTSSQKPNQQSISPPMAQKVKVAGPLPTVALDLETPGVKPKVDLPEGWMSVWSKSQRRWYFFDTKTNKSVWQWPPP